MRNSTGGLSEAEYVDKGKLLEHLCGVTDGWREPYTITIEGEIQAFPRSEVIEKRKMLRNIADNQLASTHVEDIVFWWEVWEFVEGWDD